MKPGKNSLRLKLLENRLLITTRNHQLVQKALTNLTDMIQLEVCHTSFYTIYHQLKKLERFDWLMSSTFFLYF